MVTSKLLNNGARDLSIFYCFFKKIYWLLNSFVYFYFLLPNLGLFCLSFLTCYARNVHCCFFKTRSCFPKLVMIISLSFLELSVLKREIHFFLPLTLESPWLTFNQIMQLKRCYAILESGYKNKAALVCYLEILYLEPKYSYKKPDCSAAPLLWEIQVTWESRNRGSKLINLVRDSC